MAPKKFYGTVLVTRPAEDSVEVSKLLEDHNYRAICAPFLKVVSDNVELPDLTPYRGIIFTSANAVRAAKEQIKDFSIPVLCVGNQTMAEASRAGFKQTQSVNGTVDDLVNFMARLPLGQRYLYLRGREVSEGSSALIEDVRVDEVVIYHTEKITQIDDLVHSEIRTSELQYVLFFSKRTAEAFVEWVQSDPLTAKLLNVIKRTKALCLGDSMLELVSVLPWNEVQVAENPNREGIMALIQKDTKERIKQEKEIMTKNAKKPITNASKIIERFGGIRPMAAKIDTPVTTVQGWKKRDVIPGTRRDQIMDAAADNDIDISDLTGGVSNANEGTSKSEAPAEKSKTDKAEAKISTTSVPKVMAEEKGEEKKEETAQPEKPAENVTPFKEQTPQEQTHEKIMQVIEESNKKAMVTSAWVASGMILLAGIVGAFLLWPSMKEKNAKIEALQEEVSEVNDKASRINSIVPENMQQKMDDLQMQARNIQNTFEQLSDRATDMSSGIIGADAGPISRRLMVLEEQMSALSGSSNFGGLINRIRSLEDSAQGQEQLKNSVRQLQSMVGQMDQRQENIRDGLADAQTEARGALGQTLEGVSGNDLKAAAMLIAFSQLRDSLNREEPFENDLALLEKLAGDENTELKRSLEKLAPHADEGVLTAKGLSGEFKGLAGDILASSLKGEEISFKEKFKARMSNLFRVEKEGELINGTQTQITVTKAQSLLDQGDIQGAIVELKTLDGAAGEEAKSFIEQAEVSLLAERVQQMLGENILSRVKGQLPSQLPLQGELEALTGSASQLGSSVRTVIPEDVNMDEVKQRFQQVNPMQDREIIRDEESGISILPGQQGFRGFSAGE